MNDTKNILNDPIKSTLFGKFYERIIIGWLKEKNGFMPFNGKPRVYWRKIKEIKNVNTEAAHRLKDALLILQKDKQYCTPDGFFQKDKEYYILEAKNWPNWSWRKNPTDEIKDVLLTSPQILSEIAFYRGKQYNLKGFIFSWWNRPEKVDAIAKEINHLISPRTFEIFFTTEILCDCIEKKYSWYLEIIRGVEERIGKLFRDLVGE